MRQFLDKNKTDLELSDLDYEAITKKVAKKGRNSKKRAMESSDSESDKENPLKVTKLYHNETTFSASHLDKANWTISQDGTNVEVGAISMNSLSAMEKGVDGETMDLSAVNFVQAEIGEEEEAHEIAGSNLGIVAAPCDSQQLMIVPADLIQVLISKVDSLKEDVAVLLDRFRTEEDPARSCRELFPIATPDDLDSLEDYLKDKEGKDCFVSTV